MKIRNFLFPFTLAIGVCTAYAFGQDVNAAAEEPAKPFSELGTISGIVAATGIGVQVLKRAAGNVGFFNKIPTWAFAIVISCLLTWMANSVFKILEGNFAELAWNAALLAAAASGFYTWLTQPTASAESYKVATIAANKAAHRRTTAQLWPILLAGALGSGLLGSGLSGCASNPTNRYAQARELLTTTQNVLSNQADRGSLGDEDIVAVDESLQAARAGLSAAKIRLPAGGETFDSYLDIVEAVLNKLLEIQLQKEIKPHGSSIGVGDDRRSQGNHWRGREAGPLGQGKERNHARAVGRDRSAGQHLGRPMGRDRGCSPCADRGEGGWWGRGLTPTQLTPTQLTPQLTQTWTTCRIAA